MTDLLELLKKLSFQGEAYVREIAPGVHAFGARQAMHRVRAYHSAVLSPIGGRGPLHEYLLVGHIHVAHGKITRVEGFNGQEGERWASKAAERLQEAGALSASAKVTNTTPLLACQYTRVPL